MKPDPSEWYTVWPSSCFHFFFSFFIITNFTLVVMSISLSEQQGATVLTKEEGAREREKYKNHCQPSAWQVIGWLAWKAQWAAETRELIKRTGNWVSQLHSGSCCFWTLFFPFLSSPSLFMTWTTATKETAASAAQLLINWWLDHTFKTLRHTQRERERKIYSSFSTSTVSLCVWVLFNVCTCPVYSFARACARARGTINEDTGCINQLNTATSWPWIILIKLYYTMDREMPVVMYHRIKPY